MFHNYNRSIANLCANSVGFHWSSHVWYIYTTKRLLKWQLDAFSSHNLRIIGTSLRRKNTDQKQITQRDNNRKGLTRGTESPSNQKPTTVPLGNEVIIRHQLNKSTHPNLFIVHLEKDDCGFQFYLIKFANYDSSQHSTVITIATTSSTVYTV